MSKEQKIDDSELTKVAGGGEAGNLTPGDGVTPDPPGGAPTRPPGGGGGGSLPEAEGGSGSGSQEWSD